MVQMGLIGYPLMEGLWKEKSDSVEISHNLRNFKQILAYGGAYG